MGLQLNVSLFGIVCLQVKRTLMLCSDGGEIHDQDTAARFGAILYDNRSGPGQFVFSARRWNNLTSSYICQLQQGLSKHAAPQIRSHYFWRYITLYVCMYNPQNRKYMIYRNADRGGSSYGHE